MVSFPSSLPCYSGGKQVIISLVDHNENLEFESIGKVVQIIDHHKRNPRISSSGLTISSTDPEEDVQEQEANGKIGNETNQEVMNEPEVNNKDHISHGGINSRRSHLKTHCPQDIEINERVGSCSSLVGRRYFDSLVTKRRTPSDGRSNNNGEEDNNASQDPGEEEREEQVDVQVALILYGPVILGESFFKSTYFNDLPFFLLLFLS